MLQHSTDGACEQLSAGWNLGFLQRTRTATAVLLMTCWRARSLGRLMTFCALCRASCGGPKVFWRSDSGMKAILARMCASRLPVVQGNLRWNTLDVQHICRYMHCVIGNMKTYADICRHMQEICKDMQSNTCKYMHHVSSNMHKYANYSCKYAIICKL